MEKKFEVKKLNFYYGNFQALIDVDIDVYANKITALIGPSGCGKSTFLRTLNRMNDLIPGEDIAKYTLRFENEAYMKELIDIPRMAEMATKMVNNAIKAFIDKDLRLARKVWKADEEVDEQFRNIYDELLEKAEADNKHTKQCIMFLFIAAHLERIADYATNICEEAVFSLEGNYSMS